MQANITPDSAVSETVPSKRFQGRLESIRSNLTPDDAHKWLEANVSKRLGDGTLEFGRDFLQDDQLLYYGYPVRFESINALSHYLEKHLPGKASRYDGVVAFMQQNFLERLPYSKVHEMRTFVPRYLTAADAQFASDEACWVFPVVCTKRIDNSLIDQGKSDTIKEILEEMFSLVACAPGTPHWFFGGHRYSRQNESASFLVTVLQASISTIVSAQQNPKEEKPGSNDPNQPGE